MTFERRSFDGPRKRRRSPLRIVVAVALAVALGWAWYANALRAPDASGDARISVTVPTGAGLSSVAADLEEKELIRSSFAFSTHARWNGQDRLIRAGAYVLQPSMTAAEILDVLTGGAAGEVSVTIPEGYTVADIDRLMASKGFTATGAIVACAKTCDFSAFAFLPSDKRAFILDVSPGGLVEGYLYPDTYFIGGEGSDPQAFLGRLLSTFETKVVDGLKDEIAASGKPLHDIVTMASLVEKEAAGDDERAPIAGILWKRLDVGMILGVDAAVRYAVDKKPTQPLTGTDLASDSPYNIRLHAGLTPGPIANPGFASIQAALEPETTAYFYYLHGTDGQIRYAVTNDEHNANKAKYLR